MRSCPLCVSRPIRDLKAIERHITEDWDFESARIIIIGRQVLLLLKSAGGAWRKRRQENDIESTSLPVKAVTGNSEILDFDSLSILDTPTTNHWCSISGGSTGSKILPTHTQKCWRILSGESFYYVVPMPWFSQYKCVFGRLPAACSVSHASIESNHGVGFDCILVSKGRRFFFCW